MAISIDQLRAIRDAEPFRPVVIYLVSGRAVKVEWFEQLASIVFRGTVAIDGEVVSVSVADIAAIEPAGAKS